jgi:hypothetical protein
MSINWSEIEGYREDMTAEEKLELLNNFEITPAANPAPENDPAPTDPSPAPAPAPARKTPAPAPKDMKGYVSKTQFDKVSSELAAAKKQLRSRMTEDEQKEADRQAQLESMESELTTLRREKLFNEHKASFLAQGYDEQLAEEAATAMVDGDSEGVFAAMKKFGVNMEKSMRAKIMKETPVPPAGNELNDDEKTKRETAALRQSMGLPI